jgi:Polyketide cyclase / dehydrase and lipid transport
MISIASAHVSSPAPASAFFATWADMATWPEWNTDTAWVRLDGPFATGSTGELKPKGGPKVRFVLTSVVPGEEFVDTSLLLGARLEFRHTVQPRPDGGCDVRVGITMTGPLARAWNLLLAKGFRTSVQPDLDRLAKAAELLAQTP